MASMRDLAMQLVNNVAQGFRLDKGEADSYLEVMDRSPYGTGVPLSVGYGENEMSPLDMSAIVTGMVPVLGDVTGLAADVDMYMRDPESRNIPNYLLTAAGALPFIPAASQVRKGIKAYHGSPHDFDKFSAEQIGTGEGAQAYGQGLYFTETEDVAKGYRKAISNSYRHMRRNSYINGIPEKEFMGTLSDKEAEILDAAMDEIAEGINRGWFDDIDQASDLAETLSYKLSPDADLYGLDGNPLTVPEKVSRSLLDKIDTVRIKKPRGSMYEVNIDVEPDELIDWDQLIDDQPSKVLDKLKKSDWWEYAEEGIYDRAGARGDNPTGADLIRWLEEDGGEYAAEALKDLGVKGVRYADAFTRHKTPDKRSMNYVIFDDRLISISKKYGIAIPVAAALLAKQTGEDTSQSYEEI